MASARQIRHASLHDVELCALASTGDRRAFGELARRHGSVVRGLLRRMGAGDAEADDAAQDAFIIAFERIAEFRGEGAFPAWVKKIAVRVYLRRLQRTRRLKTLLAEAGDEAPFEGEGDVEERMDLDDGLKALAPAERLCVTLCYGAGLSHAELAQAASLPLGTVKSHVKRGLEKLRARLAPQDGALPSGRRGNG